MREASKRSGSGDVPTPTSVPDRQGYVASEWIEVQPGQWVNPLTGGHTTPSPCGWCGRKVIWPVEGELHYNGVCQGRPYVPSAIAAKREPTTVLTIRWKDDEESKWVRDMSRALAQKISERFEKAEVNVKTYGTVE